MSQLMKVGAHYETEAVTGKGASTGSGGESDPLFAMPCTQIKHAAASRWHNAAHP